MQNQKFQITQKQRKNNLIFNIIIVLIISVYVGLKVGVNYVTQEEGTLLDAFVSTAVNIADKPWVIWPTSFIPVLICLLIGGFICLFMYTKYGITKDTVENVYGDAFFEENIDQYEKEFVADPEVIEEVTNKPLSKRDCPRNEEGKKIYTKLNPSSKRWHSVMEECRRRSMIYTDKIYLSLNGKWCQRNTNAMIFGASGAGKSRFFLLPNILQGYGSFICTDPSGDVMQKCGYFLKQSGYDIRCFSISDMSKSCRFNPLHYIRDTKDIAIIAQTFLDNTKDENSKSGDDFWDKSAMALLCACIGYLYEVCPPEQQNLSNVLELLKTDKHEENEQPGTLSDFDEMFEALGEANPISYAYQCYSTYIQAPVKTRNSILISTSVKLQQLDIPEVKNLTYKDEMGLDEVGEKPMAIFLNIPQADPTFKWLTAMLYSLLFKRLYQYGEDRQRKSAIDAENKVIDPDTGKVVKALNDPEMKVPVKFLIDECANVGKIPNLDNYLATCRKYRISIVPIFQSYSQIVEVYGEQKANSIVANCDAFLFLGGTDEKTLKIIHDRLGKETVKTLSHNMPNKGGYSVNKQMTGQDLMTRDQIETMSNAECILFIRALRPFKTKKYSLERHPNAKYLAEGECGKAYINPFNVSDDDELIEDVRLKNIDEDGYIAPSVVDSARRKTLILSNRKKANDIEVLINEKEEELKNASPDEVKELKILINNLKKELDKLQKTDPDLNGENEQRRELGIEPFVPGEETPVKTKSCDEVMQNNPDLSDVVSILSTHNYDAAYEFDINNDFNIKDLI